MREQLKWYLALVLVLLAVVMILACIGCASPTVHFYTFNASAPPPAPFTTPVQSSALLADSPPFYIEIAPVDIPAQVSRPQLVITTCTGEVELKEQQRWLAPLNDEIRNALSEALMDRLSTIDVYRMPHPLDRPVYRVTVNVQRFISTLSTPGDLRLGRLAPDLHDSRHFGRALIRAAWSVRLVVPQRRLLQLQPQAQATMIFTGHSSAVATVSASDQSYQALVLAHQRALAHIADDIATVIRERVKKTQTHQALSQR